LGLFVKAFNIYSGFCPGFHDCKCNLRFGVRYEYYELTKITTPKIAMKISKTKTVKSFLPFAIIAATLSAFPVKGALIVLDPLQVVADQTFNNTTTTTGAPTFTVVSTSGIGTPTYTINYRYTTDLSAYGYSPTSSFDFAMTVTTTDGNISDAGTLGATNGATVSIDPGESLTYTLSYTPTGPFTGVTIGNVQSYGPGDMRVTSTSGYDVTNTANNPGFFLDANDFTIENVDPGTDTGSPGFINFRIAAAVPEPSSTALLGLGLSSLLLRRRRS
jgi:hypothetical protein